MILCLLWCGKSKWQENQGQLFPCVAALGLKLWGAQLFFLIKKIIYFTPIISKVGVKS